MKKCIYKFSIKLFGDQKSYHFEHRFINSLSICISITAFIGFIINLILNLGIFEVILTLVTTAIYFGVYGLSRFYQKVELAKWLAIFSAYPILSLLWLNSAGSLGPIPYTYYLLLLSVVLLTDSWPRFFLLLLIGINVCLCFYFENKFFEWMVPYEDDTARRIDLVTSILLYFILGTIIMSYSKRNYIKEKQNAQKADKLKTAFLANMSHEIRTPMNAIMGFTDLLKKKELPKEKKEKYFEIVNENVEYLLRLIDDILDFSLIESDQLMILPTDFDLNTFMKSLEISHQQFIPNNKKGKIKFFYETSDQNYIIRTDKTRFEQIFSNLIINAIKFTNKGYIKFGFIKRTNDFLFYVEDTGIGIDKKDITSVFDRFVKLDNDNYAIQNRGTGIGLSIAKKMVELLNGKIWIQSILNEGSVFYFNLPLVI